MANEIHVLFAGKLPSAAALTRAMKELGFPLSITREVRSLEQHSGFMPMKLRREESGIEFAVFEERAVVEELAGNDIDPRFMRSASFRWGGDEQEMLCALCAAAALATLVNGMVLEEQENRLLTPDEAIGYARKHLESAKAPAPQRGTRPADIKRYLKPLLSLRSDLVLVGRLLVIRPVRHLLRGALFERREKLRFQIWRYINPLYASPAGGGYGLPVETVLWEVWQPHFEPLLMDSLAEDVFDGLGQITTLEGFATETITGQPRRPGWWDDILAPITALVLAGEFDLAV
jgi:hypothetical protein